MPDTIPFYVFLSIFAIFVKLYIALFHHKAFFVSGLWLIGFFIAALFLNIFEFFGFFYPKDGPFKTHLLSAYYVSVLLVGYFLFRLTLQVTGSRIRVINLSVFLLFTLSLIVVLVPGAGIAGVKHLGYVYTRIAGPYYWVIQLFFIFSMPMNIILLAWSARKHSEVYVKRCSAAMLISSAPIVFVSLLVIVLMQAGFQINMAGFGSFTISLFLIALMLTDFPVGGDDVRKSVHSIYRFLSFFPLTRENKLLASMRSSLYQPTGAELQTASNEFERAVIADVLRDCDGNKSLAAKKLGISRSTLRKKLIK